MSAAAEQLATPEAPRLPEGGGAQESELELPQREGPTPEEIQVPVLENLDRAITALITIVPPLLLVLVGWQMWNHELHWRDIVIFLMMYVPITLGVTVGFHRLLTHRSFRPRRRCAGCWRCWERCRSRGR